MSREVEVPAESHSIVARYGGAWYPLSDNPPYPERKDGATVTECLAVVAGAVLQDSIHQ